MKPLSKLCSNQALLVLLTVLVKVPIFFTRHIQEDAYITWRVARNFLESGVIGFNGAERISASTTHLYVAVSAIFQAVFGDFFIYPVLIFSSVLFAVGSIWLARIFFKDDLKRQFIFVLLLNVVPPALTASCVGMEYGVLFFLYCGLIYHGVFLGRKWAYFVFPVLLLWTRLDAALFLSVFFVADLLMRRRISIAFLVGGILGIFTVVAFNYLYFGEWVNHTITAKKIAYKNVFVDSSWKHILLQWAYYGGLIKKYSVFTLAVFLIFLVFLAICLLKIIKDKKFTDHQKILLLAITVFALVKISVFAYFQAYFDWYYWLPRVFLFAVVIVYLLRYLPLNKKIVLPGFIIVFGGLYLFQFLQSYAIGYMEDGQRRRIAEELSVNASPKHSIMLEPAGIIPFHTRFYTYDEVGLVNKKMTAEMLKDEEFWWINSVRKFRPDYILTVNYEVGDPASYYHLKPSDSTYFSAHYKAVKTFPIADLHKNAPAILKWIYELRPIGKDYHLYKKL